MIVKDNNVGMLSAHVTLYLLTFTLNKYVLSVLNFTYPTIFQGWQVLVGGLLLKLATYSGRCSLSITSLDKPGFTSLVPHFLFFTGLIVSGSKALANLPIPVFLSLHNVILVFVILLKMSSSLRTLPYIHILGLVGTLLSAMFIVLFDLDMMLTDVPYFWMLIHILCAVVMDLHASISDARYSATDRLYFSYIFSLIILTPASLYLEEAFQALNFPDKTRYEFVFACLASGVTGVLLNISSIHIQSNDLAGKIQVVAKLVTCGLSLFLFNNVISYKVWTFIILNFVSTLFLPNQPKEFDEGKEDGANLV